MQYYLSGMLISSTTVRKLLRHNYKRIKNLKAGNTIWLHPQWVQTATGINTQAYSTKLSLTARAL